MTDFVTMNAIEKPRAENTKSPVPLRFKGDDLALVEALKKGHPGAMEALYDRYSVHVERVLTRVLGFDRDLYDLLHDVFLEAFRSVNNIKDGQALQSWLTSLSVFISKQYIRKRIRRRAYWVKDSEPHMNIPVGAADPANIELLRHTYQALDKMSADDRIILSLRFFEQLHLIEIAEVCNISMSTVKRRLKRAEKKFRMLALNHSELKSFYDDQERRRE